MHFLSIGFILPRHDIDPADLPGVHLHNVRLARQLWAARAHPRQVNGTTDSWLSCLGGHLAHWTEFQTLSGAYSSEANPAPVIIRNDGTPVSADVRLFGESMWHATTQAEVELQLTNWQLVMHRLDQRERQLTGNEEQRSTPATVS
jgi:hypothetical protein